jgi:hypothetical protein
MNIEECIIFEPNDNIWLFPGYIPKNTPLLKHASQVKETDFVDLSEVKELQLVETQNDIADFYTYATLVPKGGTIIFSKAEIWLAGEKRSELKSYFSPQGDNHPPFAKALEIIDRFLKNQVEVLHNWELVSIYRPRN